MGNIEKRIPAREKVSGDEEHTAPKDFHIQQENQEIFHESGLQGNQQRYHESELSDKAAIHLYEDEESAHRISSTRVQHLTDSNSGS